MVLSSENNNNYENFTLKVLPVGCFKKSKHQKDTIPIIFIIVDAGIECIDVITLKVLLDTGTTTSLIKCPNFNNKQVT